MTASFRKFVEQLENQHKGSIKMFEESQHGMAVYKDADIDKMFASYVTTALWSSNSDGIEGLDTMYNADDISEEAAEKMLDNCKEFVQQAGSLLQGLDPIQVGHDFWLTQQHHGAGFWDGGYDKDIGEKLTDISHNFSESNLFVGDDGLIYMA